MADVPTYMHWLPADSLAKLERLEFLARGTVEGFIAGKHRSARKGASTEFAEHRQYVKGDDPRTLDWRLIARRQRLYVKQYVDETNLRATVLLDASGSMDFAGARAAGGKTKFDYARHVAAALVYLLVRQQDAAGFASFDVGVRDYMPARARPAQIRAILEAIDACRPGGETDCADAIHEIAERIPRRSVVFLVGDLYGNAEELLKALHHFRFRHHEVVVLQVVDDDELEFPFADAIEFEDAESHATLNVDAQAIKKEYLARLEAHEEKIRKGCGEMNVTHEILRTSVPWADALSDVLVRYR